MQKHPLILFSLCLHFIWLLIFLLFFKVGSDTVPPEATSVLKWLGLPNNSDALSQAADLGRLDLVSLSLTVLGAVLALAALGSYFVMRHTVLLTTREEASIAIPNEVKKTVTIELLIQAIKSDPVLLDKLQKAARDGVISDKAADDIADYVDEEDA